MPVGARLAADRDQDLLAASTLRRRPRARPIDLARPRRDRARLGAGAHVDAALRAARRPPARRRTAPRAASSRSPPSTSVTSAPSVDHACASSTPTGPPPRTTRLSGTCLTVVASRLFQGSASREPVDRRHRRAAAGRDHDRLARRQHVVADDRPAARRRAARRRGRARCRAPRATAAGPSRRGRGSPRRGARARPRRRARRSPPRATPGTRRASASSSPGRSSAFDGMQA